MSVRGTQGSSRASYDAWKKAQSHRVRGARACKVGARRALDGERPAGSAHEKRCRGAGRDRDGIHTALRTRHGGCCRGQSMCVVVSELGKLSTQDVIGAGLRRTVGGAIRTARSWQRRRHHGCLRGLESEAGSVPQVSGQEEPWSASSATFRHTGGLPVSFCLRRWKDKHKADAPGRARVSGFGKRSSRLETVDGLQTEGRNVACTRTPRGAADEALRRSNVPWRVGPRCNVEDG